MNIQGQTNVLSQRFGPRAAVGLGEEIGRFVVTTMDVPWRLAAERIGGRPDAVLIADSMEFDVVEAQIAWAPDCDTVLAVGGGRAIDLGKYLAFRRGCRLVTVPTILSVDAFVTPAAGLRRNHRVEYVGSASPDPLVIDYELLRTAPAELNVAGVGDLLSIHTATFDWELAARAGRDDHAFSAEAVQQARAILDLVRRRADAIRNVEDDGLLAIVEGSMRVNTICLPAGHYRVEEGSEHYLFYELEERLRRPFVHGHIIGLGIAIMSRLQDNEPEAIKDLMQRLSLRYHPVDVQVSRDDLVASLMSLRDYTERTGLWYTVINERTIDQRTINRLLEDVRFA